MELSLMLMLKLRWSLLPLCSHCSMVYWVLCFFVLKVSVFFCKFKYVWISVNDRVNPFFSQDLAGPWSLMTSLNHAWLPGPWFFQRRYGSIKKGTPQASQDGDRNFWWINFMLCLPETNSSHLKMDGWKTIVSFWDGLFWGVFFKFQGV